MEAEELLKEREELTFGSGVTVSVKPFPAQLYQRIQERALEEHPDETPPKKKIKVVDGFEEIDDLEDLNYKTAQATAESERNRWSSTRILNYVLRFCVELDLKKWEPVIKELEEMLYPFPKDKEKRKVEFLTSHAVKTQEEYAMLMMASIRLMMVSDPEVSRRIQFFRREMEGAAAVLPALETPGTDEDERMEVQPEAEGT